MRLLLLWPIDAYTRPKGWPTSGNNRSADRLWELVIKVVSKRLATVIPRTIHQTQPNSLGHMAVTVQSVGSWCKMVLGIGTVIRPFPAVSCPMNDPWIVKPIMTESWLNNGSFISFGQVTAAPSNRLSIGHCNGQSTKSWQVLVEWWDASHHGQTTDTNEQE